MVEMTDFYSVLQRAVASLPDGSGPQRRAVYDKARKALLKQLQSFDPPLPSADVTAQRLALEDAIRKIENDIARQIRARRAVEGAASAKGAGRSGAGGTSTYAQPRIAAPARTDTQSTHIGDDEGNLLESAVSEATIATPEADDAVDPVRRLAPAAPLSPDPRAVDEPEPDDPARLFEAEDEDDVAPRPRRRARRPDPIVDEPEEADYEHVPTMPRTMTPVADGLLRAAPSRPIATAGKKTGTTAAKTVARPASGRRCAAATGKNARPHGRTAVTSVPRRHGNASPNASGASASARDLCPASHCRSLWWCLWQARHTQR